MKGMVNLRAHRTPRPITLVIMDGVGYREDTLGNAVASSLKPNLDWLPFNCRYRLIRAHGTAVGLPSDDDMGNSEVGHNALGGGRCYPQGARPETKQSNPAEFFRAVPGRVLSSTASNIRVRCTSWACFRTEMFTAI